MDTYDGTVFQIAGDARGADFRRVGSAFTDDPRTRRGPLKLFVFVADYRGFWVPGGGTVRSLTYTNRRETLSESLYYSENLGTALSTRQLNSR